MKNKTLTKKMKAELTTSVMGQIITEEGYQAKIKAGTVVLRAYEEKYGSPESPQQLAYVNIPLSIVPEVFTLPVIIQMADHTAVERNVDIPRAVRFAKGMLPVVIKEERIVTELAIIKKEEAKTEQVREVVEKAINSMPGTFKAIQLWPELQPTVLGLFYTNEELRKTSEEEIKEAKDAIQKVLAEQKPETDFEAVEEMTEEVAEKEAVEAVEA